MCNLARGAQTYVYDCVKLDKVKHSIARIVFFYFYFFATGGAILQYKTYSRCSQRSHWLHSQDIMRPASTQIKNYFGWTNPLNAVFGPN